MSQNNVHLWLRHEVKPNEHRAALSPQVAKKLLENGFKVTVERSPARFFKDEEYEQVGCALVESNSWPQAPLDAIIIGLKELPEEPATPLPHTHILFAHCFKEQAGWKEILGRFIEGKGTILDLEFLTDDSGRRVAAFGYHAGFNGAAAGLDLWCHNHNNSGTAYPKITSYPNEDTLIQTIKEKLGQAIKNNQDTHPKVMVMGALGRCGKGAVDFLKASGIPHSNILEWDMHQTAKGGPFKEIVDVDIFINCIYLSKKIPPFLTPELLESDERSLSVVVDVSCDYTSPYNPIPIYHQGTTFDHPSVVVPTHKGPRLEVISIDHLPTMLPRESSHQYSSDLLPTLLTLKDRHNNSVWKRAEALFHEKANMVSGSQS